MSSFQNISFDNPQYTLEIFDINFINITSNSYIIQLFPKKNQIITNLTVIATTISKSSTPINGSSGNLFLDSNYNLSKQAVWSCSNIDQSDPNIVIKNLS